MISGIFSTIFPVTFLRNVLMLITLSIQLYQMGKWRRDYLNSEFYKSLNHDPFVPCCECGRLPYLYEEAFPHKICEDCYEIWLDKQWEEKYGAHNHD